MFSLILIETWSSFDQIHDAINVTQKLNDNEWQRYVK